MSEESAYTPSRRSVVGLLDAETLPATGSESARRPMDPASVPSDLLVRRAEVG